MELAWGLLYVVFAGFAALCVFFGFIGVLYLFSVLLIAVKDGCAFLIKKIKGE